MFPDIVIFTPDEAGVYGGECLLVAIRCQACGAPYDVCLMGPGRARTFKDDIDVWATVDAGDPPNACCDGTSMLAWTIRVLQFWERPKAEWLRVSRYEILLGDAASVSPPDPLAPKTVESRLTEMGRGNEYRAALQSFDEVALLRFFELAELDRAGEIVENMRSKRESKHS